MQIQVLKGHKLIIRKVEENWSELLWKLLSNSSRFGLNHLFEGYAKNLLVFVKQKIINPRKYDYKGWL